MRAFRSRFFPPAAAAASVPVAPAPSADGRLPVDARHAAAREALAAAATREAEAAAVASRGPKPRAIPPSHDRPFAPAPSTAPLTDTGGASALASDVRAAQRAAFDADKAARDAASAAAEASAAEARSVAEARQVAAMRRDMRVVARSAPPRDARPFVPRPSKRKLTTPASPPLATKRRCVGREGWA